jgi:CheY-like chemotaxis protein
MSAEQEAEPQEIVLETARLTMTSSQPAALNGRPSVDRRLRNSPVAPVPEPGAATTDGSSHESLAAHRHQLLAAAGHPFTDARLMIVTGDSTSATDVRRHLREWSYHRFQTPSDLPEVLQFVLQDPPDLVIIDVMSLGSEGLTLLESLHHTTLDRDVPILVLVAATATATRHRALELGATDLITKPIDSAEIAVRVRNALSFVRQIPIGVCNNKPPPSPRRARQLCSVWRGPANTGITARVNTCCVSASLPARSRVSSD